MAKRKTFDVDTFRNLINGMLAGSVCSSEERKSMLIILEHVLMETGNYNGYRYLGSDKVPEGHLPGINTNAFENHNNPTPDQLFQNTDNTRVFYF
jgi:hypothetical protein